MEWIFGIISVLFGVIGYLLSLKDKRQGEEIAEMKVNYKTDIDNLYRLHHDDEERLAEYKLAVAQNHYTQPQVDYRFQQLDTTMKEGFRELKSEFSTINVELKELTKSLAEKKL